MKGRVQRGGGVPDLPASELASESMAQLVHVYCENLEGRNDECAPQLGTHHQRNTHTPGGYSAQPDLFPQITSRDTSEREGEPCLQAVDHKPSVPISRPKEACCPVCL